MALRCRQKVQSTLTQVAPRRLTAAQAYPLSGGVPYRLNTSTIAGEGAGASAASKDTLGTLAFAPEFLRRLEAAVRAELWEDHLPYSQWHRSPYVVARLAKAFGWPIIQAVYARNRAVCDFQDDPTSESMTYDAWYAYLDAAVAPFGMTARQVERADWQIQGLLRGRLMSYRPTYHPPQIIQQSA